MTASERRLHPASILFDIARYARIFAWPALLAWLGLARGVGDEAGPGAERYGPFVSGFETWLWVLVLPSVALSIVRYLTFRLRYEPDELVIRSGLVFRNVRHVPFARIQNLDAVQNVVHRALGVVDVRVQTGGGGSEPEARLSVLPVAALDEMRARVFADRRVVDEASVASDGPSSSAAPVPARVLLHLPPGQLALLGLLENRGLVLVGAGYGALWETGLMDRVWSLVFAGAIDARGLMRELVAFVFGRGPLPVGRLALAVAGIGGFLVVVRLVSMAWAVFRLWDFTLSRRGDDLRVTYGLLTRVTATIPLRRIQSLTVRRGWLHRRLGRASIRVETAGGETGTAARDREWLAPLIREAEVRALCAEALPDAVPEAAAWQPVHPRATGRAVRRALLGVAIPASALLLAAGWRALWVIGPLVGWSAFVARQHVRHLAWQVSDRLAALRSGWWSTAETIVRVNRIQAVRLGESPFDRRARMARVRVDTAGAGERSHRVDIPYLDAARARDVQRQLARAAARTEFQW